MNSVSSLKTFSRCPRLYRYKYIDRYEGTIGSENLEVGLAVHTGLEILKSEGDLEEAITYARHEFTEATKNSTRIVAELQIQGWKSRWANDGMVYLENELEFEVNGLRGVIDGIARDIDGNTVLVEHKTTQSKLDETGFYWNRYDIPWQLDLYCWASEQLGYKIDYCLLDVIRVHPFRIGKATPKSKQQFYLRDSKHGKKGDPKPGTRLKNESLPEFKSRVMNQLATGVYDNFARRVFIRTPGEIAATVDDWKDIEQAQKALVYPRAPGSCRMGRFTCDFLPVCSQETSLNNDQLYRLRPNRNS